MNDCCLTVGWMNGEKADEDEKSCLRSGSRAVLILNILSLPVIIDMFKISSGDDHPLRTETVSPLVEFAIPLLKWTALYV